MIKHTPGPWFTLKIPGANCRVYAESENHAIARTYGPELNGIGVCSLTGPQNEADARLISAAPDLLCVAQRFISEYEENEEDEWSREWQDLASAFRAAIAKATGGET